MTIRFREADGSGSGKTSLDAGSNAKYLGYLIGAATRIEAETWLILNSAVPAVWVTATHTLLFREYEISHKTGDLWEVVAHYVHPSKSSEERPEEGSFKFRASSTNKTVNRKVGLSHVASFARPNEQAADHKGAINVEDGEAKGVDIPVAGSQLVYTFSHSSGSVTEAFHRALHAAVNKVNSATWHGYSAGELRFVEFDAGDGSAAPAEVQLVFDYEPNVTNATYGDIQNVSHDGHDYIWFEFEALKDDNAKVLVARPRAAHVERMFLRANFSSLFGF